MRCEHSLPVLSPFDRPKHLSKIAAHPPEGFAKVFCKFHPLQLGEPRGQVLLSHPGETPSRRLCGITSDDEVVGLGRILALNHAIQAGEAQLVNLAALCLYGIVDRAMAEFLGQEVLRARSDA